MDREVYTLALTNTLNEIRNVCPDITNAFIFNEEGEIVAADERTTEKTTAHIINAFDSVLEKADAIGGIECIVLRARNGRVNVSCFNDLYFVTATSKHADMKYVNTVTKVLIPTILKLLEKIGSTSIESKPNLPKIESEPLADEPEEPSFRKPFEEESAEEHEETGEKDMKPETPLVETPVNQLIVENLGGLLVPSDTVRIDNEVLSQWESLYEGTKIEEVEIETFDGKSTRCKAKPIKEAKYEGKGIIQMPEKIQLALEIKKGELVRAKPVVN